MDDGFCGVFLALGLVFGLPYISGCIVNNWNALGLTSAVDIWGIGIIPMMIVIVPIIAVGILGKLIGLLK